MAKASIKDIKDEFIEKKKKKEQKQKEKRRGTSVYLSEDAQTLLRLHKVCTNENISDFVEKIIREKLKGRYNLEKIKK